jgi:hypothetical protein
MWPGSGFRRLGAWQPNNSSKPTPLRYGKGGTEKRATFASTTRCGLTQVLGLKSREPLLSSRSLLAAMRGLLLRLLASRAV